MIVIAPRGSLNLHTFTFLIQFKLITKLSDKLQNYIYFEWGITLKLVTDICCF